MGKSSIENNGTQIASFFLEFWVSCAQTLGAFKRKFEKVNKPKSVLFGLKNDLNKSNRILRQGEFLFEIRTSNA